MYHRVRPTFSARGRRRGGGAPIDAHYKSIAMFEIWLTKKIYIAAKMIMIVRTIIAGSPSVCRTDLVLLIAKSTGIIRMVHVVVVVDSPRLVRCSQMEWQKSEVEPMKQ
jgi:hypothetical protein